jgi:hypothetical protein
MTIEIDDITETVRRLDVAKDTPQQNRQKPLRLTSSQPASLQAAIQTLIRVTKDVTAKAQSIESLASDAKFSGNLRIPEILSLREGSKTLAQLNSNLQTTIETLNEATENAIIANLTSLGGNKDAETVSLSEESLVEELLSHFNEQIRGIVRRVLDSANEKDLLLKVAEECYKQASSPSGVLQADDYFHSLEESCLQWPYDPDFESEQYYEHEDRLILDKDYAVASWEEEERRNEACRKESQSWIDFWVRVLHEAPAGPTLFYPPASPHVESLNLDAIPQYLFRTFDGASSGLNNESVIASTSSQFRLQASRTDILSLEKGDATKLLHEHLTKSPFGAHGRDNLVSWTSSLLFAVQYAIWRFPRGRYSASGIHICAVDTRNFPREHFARDLWLLKEYRANAAQLGGGEERFFDFRLKSEDYYNGEYLSQGVLNHEDRSCIVSLEQLINAGLYELYPEFDDQEGSEKWAKRVRELRQIWSAEHTTTDREIELALKIGRECFTQFEPLAIACMLLSFKNRKSTQMTARGEFPNFVLSIRYSCSQ